MCAFGCNLEHIICGFCFYIFYIVSFFDTTWHNIISIHMQNMSQHQTRTICPVILKRDNIRIILFRKRIMETLRTVPVRMWLIPGMCIGLSYLLNNVALSMTDATSVAFLRSLSVVMTPSA